MNGIRTAENEPCNVCPIERLAEVRMTAELVFRPGGKPAVLAGEELCKNFTTNPQVRPLSGRVSKSARFAEIFRNLNFCNFLAGSISILQIQFYI